MFRCYGVRIQYPDDGSRRIQDPRYLSDIIWEKEFEEDYDSPNYTIIRKGESDERRKSINSD